MFATKAPNIPLILRVAKKYYELHQTQEQIAKTEHISVSMISRLLRKATELGYVKFQVMHPIESIAELEDTFGDLFSLEKVFICPALVDDYVIRLHDTCRAVAREIGRLIDDDAILGISWGRTMDALSTFLEPRVPQPKNLRVVQLNGSVAERVSSIQSAFIIERFVQTYQAEGYLLPAPLVVDTREIAAVLLEDSRIRSVIQLGRECDVALFSVGCLSKQSVLFEQGIFKQAQFDDLYAKGAVGDVLSRYFSIDGALVDAELDARTVGVTLGELLQKRFRIGVAVGEHKAEAIIGALRGKYINWLYTDEITARAVITKIKSGSSALVK